jgi:hypothetical protein
VYFDYSEVVVDPPAARVQESERFGY